MKTHPKFGFIVLLISCFSSCSHPPKVEWPKLPEGFPLGGNNFNHSIDKVKYAGCCSKIVVSEGNGRFGYQSFMVDKENNIEVRLFDEGNKRLAHVFRTSVSGNKPLIEELLKSLEISALWRSYSTQFADGAGGQLAIIGGNGDIYRCWMSNYYPPEFRKLWSRIQRLVEEIPAENWKYSGRLNRFLIYKEYMEDK